MSAYVAINFRRQPRWRRWRQPLILHHLFLPILAALLIAAGDAAAALRRSRSPVNDTRAIFAFYCGCGSLVWKLFANPSSLLTGLDWHHLRPAARYCNANTHTPALPSLCWVYPNCSIAFFISLPANLIFRFCTGVSSLNCPHSTKHTEAFEYLPCLRKDFHIISLCLLF